MSFQTTRNAGLGIILIILFCVALIPSYMILQIRIFDAKMAQELTELSNANRINDLVQKASVSFYNLIIYPEKKQSSVIRNLEESLTEARELERYLQEKSEKDSELEKIRQIILNIRKFEMLFRYYEAEIALDPTSDSSYNMEKSTVDAQSMAFEGIYAFINDIYEDIRNTQAGMNKSIESGQQASLAGLLTGLSTALLVIWAMTAALNRPVEKLVEGTRKLAEGNTDFRIEIDSDDEMGQLASAFNHMLNRLHHTRSELNRTQMQLIQSGKLASLGELSAGVAHELNQPLMVTRTMSQLLLRKIGKEDVQKEKIKEYCEMIERSSEKMVHIINHLRIFSRQSQTVFSPVDANKVIHDALLMIREQLRLRDIEVETHLTPELPLTEGDANQLEQVFLNLISNARDAIEENGKNGKRCISITSRVSHEADYIEIQVRDSGCGISAEQQEHIFDPFFTSKEVGKGTGLGLSISYGIIENHKGKIEVYESGPQGSTFRIRLLPIEEKAAGDLA